jgi:hypothetical protein
MANLGAESINRFARPEWRFLADADTRIDQDECLELVGSSREPPITDGDCRNE